MFKMSVKVVVSSPREVKDKGFYGEFFFFGGSISVPLNDAQAEFFRSSVGEEMELSFDIGIVFRVPCASPQESLRRLRFRIYMFLICLRSSSGQFLRLSFWVFLQLSPALLILRMQSILWKTIHQIQELIFFHYLYSFFFFPYWALRYYTFFFSKFIFSLNFDLLSIF